jgi:hypothetical protein
MEEGKEGHYLSTNYKAETVFFDFNSDMIQQMSIDSFGQCKST